MSEQVCKQLYLPRYCIRQHDRLVHLLQLGRSKQSDDQKWHHVRSCREPSCQQHHDFFVVNHEPLYNYVREQYLESSYNNECEQYFESLQYLKFLQHFESLVNHVIEHNIVDFCYSNNACWSAFLQSDRSIWKHLH